MHSIFLKLLILKSLPLIIGWKLSKIIPIPKLYREFRPIAILPYLSKVLEGLIGAQITDHLICSNLFCERQFDFKKEGAG